MPSWPRGCPEGPRYTTYQLADKVSFALHFVESEYGAAAFAGLPAFQRYRSTIDARCEIRPSTSQVTEIGAFDSL